METRLLCLYPTVPTLLVWWRCWCKVQTHTHTHRAVTPPERHVLCLHHHDYACTQCMHMSDDCIRLLWLMPISVCLRCSINVLSWLQQFLSLFVEEDGSLPFHSSAILPQFKSEDQSVTIFFPEDVSLQ